MTEADPLDGVVLLSPAIPAYLVYKTSSDASAPSETPISRVNEGMDAQGPSATSARETAAPASPHAPHVATTIRHKRKRSCALIDDVMYDVEDDALMEFSTPFRNRRRAVLSHREEDFRDTHSHNDQSFDQNATIGDSSGGRLSGLESLDVSSLAPLYLQREQVRQRIVDSYSHAGEGEAALDSDWPRALAACATDSSSARAARGLVRLHLAGCSARKSSTRLRLELAHRRVSDYFTSLMRNRPTPNQDQFQRVQVDLCGSLMSAGQELEQSLRSLADKDLFS